MDHIKINPVCWTIHLLLLSAFLARICGDQAIAQFPAGRLEAAEACDKRGGMVLPEDKYSNISWRGFMQDKSISSMWLRPVKTEFSYPVWVNGRPADKNMVENSWGHCGSFHTRDNVIVLRECNERGHGFICHYQDARDCDICQKGLAHVHCLILFNACYRMYFRSNNWFEARTHCLRDKGDLAVLDDEHLLDSMAKERRNLKAKELIYWIGFRQVKWSESDEDKNRIRSTHQRSLWLPDEPNPRYNCKIALYVNNEYGWKSENCSGLHRSVCVQPGSKKEMQNGKRKVDSQNSGRTTSLLSVLISLVAVLLIVFVGYMARQRIRGLFHRLCKTKPARNDEREACLTADVFNDKDQPQITDNGTVTVDINLPTGGSANHLQNGSGVMRSLGQDNLPAEAQDGMPPHDQEMHDIRTGK